MHARLLDKRMLQHLIHVSHRNELHIILDTIRDVFQIPFIVLRQQYFLVPRSMGG
ncbi:hypothetical protein D1872_296140 [compost metagenome]